MSDFVLVQNQQMGTPPAPGALGTVVSLLPGQPAGDAPSVTGGWGEWVDVTNLNPEPAIGWTYDGTNFSGTAVQNKATITGKAQGALAANLAFLALPSPSPTQVSAQVQALTRAANALLMMGLGQYNSTAGT
jgi:hypothetical protein